MAGYWPGFNLICRRLYEHDVYSQKADSVIIKYKVSYNLH